MQHLTTILDKVANELEARGLKKLAAEVDVVANTLEKVAYDLGSIVEMLNKTPLHKIEELSKNPKFIEAIKKAFHTGTTAVEGKDQLLMGKDQLLSRLKPEVREALRRVIRELGLLPAGKTAMDLSRALILGLVAVGMAFGGQGANKLDAGSKGPYEGKGQTSITSGPTMQGPLGVDALHRQLADLKNFGADDTPEEFGELADNVKSLLESNTLTLSEITDLAKQEGASKIMGKVFDAIKGNLDYSKIKPSQGGTSQGTEGKLTMEHGKNVGWDGPEDVKGVQDLAKVGKPALLKLFKSSGDALDAKDGLMNAKTGNMSVSVLKVTEGKNAGSWALVLQNSSGDDGITAQVLNGPEKLPNL